MAWTTEHRLDRKRAAGVHSNPELKRETLLQSYPRPYFLLQTAMKVWLLSPVESPSQGGERQTNGWVKVSAGKNDPGLRTYDSAQEGHSNAGGPNSDREHFWG